MKRNAKSWVSIMLAILMTATMFPFSAFAEEPEDETKDSIPIATGTIYYVDSVAGDDTNDGTSISDAFKTLDKVNGITLNAGDGISLKKDSVFENERLYPKGRGTEENPIVITSYGTGNMPLINTNKAFRESILIENMEHVFVNSIEMTNDDAFNATSNRDDPNNTIGNNDRSLGVHVQINEDAPTFVADKREWQNITIDGCYIHNVDGDENIRHNKLAGGIGIEVRFRNSNALYPYFNGVYIQNNMIRKVDRCGIKGIRLTELSLGEDAGGDNIRHDNVRRATKNQTNLNYVVKGNSLSDVGGDGILVDSTRAAKIEHNVLHNHTMRGQGANAGIWSWNAFDTLFRFNESYGGPAYNQDGNSFDSDYWSAGTIFEYNYSHDTPMGFILMMGGNDTDIVRYNISQNDGAMLRWSAAQGNNRSFFYNNIFYYDAAKWKLSIAGGDTAIGNYTMSNNIFYNYNTQISSDWHKTKWNGHVGNIFENNIVYEASGKAGDNQIPNAIMADPMFKNPGGGGTNDWDTLKAYQVKEGSPAINTGSYIYITGETTLKNQGLWDHGTDRSAKTDFYGTPLYIGTPDIGVEESSFGSSTSSMIEANATYRFYNANGRRYLNKSDGLTLSSSDKKANNQLFTVIRSGAGFKIRIWDQQANTYAYLDNDKGTPALTADTEPIWNLTDLNNGMYSIENDGKYLSLDAGVVILEDTAKDSFQWRLYLEHASLSYNVGGPEVEGFSSEQAKDEASKQSGWHASSDVAVVGSGNNFYDTARTADSLGFTFYTEETRSLYLYFKELEKISDRTFDIIVNGKVHASRVTIPAEESVYSISDVSPVDGVVDVTLKYSYNPAGQKTKPILNAVALEKSASQTEAVNDTLRINAGSATAWDGMEIDTAYSENQNGYYGTSQSLESSRGLPSPDIGMGTALKSARTGEQFGYKFNLDSGKYRVKLYFNDFESTAEKQRLFDIFIAGQLVKENFDIYSATGGTNKGIVLTFTGEAQDNILDIELKGKNGTKAMLGAILVENYPATIDGRTNIALNKIVTASHQKGNIPDFAVDGNDTTRWESLASAGQSITVDLGDEYMVDTMAMDWTAGAYATKGYYEVSKDNSNWMKVKQVTETPAGLHVITFKPTQARYVRFTAEGYNDSWGMSPTEFMVFGTGPISLGEISLGIEQGSSRTEQKLTVSASGVTQKFSRLELNVAHDTDAVLSINADTALHTGLSLLSSDSDTTDNRTTNTYLFDIVSSSSLETPVDILEITYNLNSGKRALIEVSANFIDAAGDERILPVKQIFVPNEIELSELETLIAAAKEIMENAVVGVKPGNYTQESVDALHAAIVAAETGKETAAAADLAGRYIELQSSIDAFLESEFVFDRIVYHKDFLFDDESGFTGGNISIEDGMLKAVMGTNSQLYDVNAPLLDEGTLWMRFKVSNFDDQTKFVVGKIDGQKRIEIGYDRVGANWFYEGATPPSPGWGNFPGKTAPVGNIEQTMRVDFTPDNQDKSLYKVNAVLNGSDLGTINAVFGQGKGKYMLQTRRTGKTFYLQEVYYTNSTPYYIDVSAEPNGSVSETGSILTFEGAKKSFKLQPDAGYEVSKVLVDGKEVSILNNIVTIDYVSGDHTIAIEFDIASARSELQSLYDEYSVLTNTDSKYTMASWTDLQTALNEASAILDNPTALEDDIAGILERLKAATGNLTLQEIDKSLLQAAIHSVLALTESDYTDESWAELAAAVSNGNAVLDDADATQMDVDDATASINSAIAALIPVDPAGVDKLLLQAAIHSVMALTKSDYTDESWAELAAAVSNGNAVLDDADATQMDVDDATASINSAIAALIPVDPAGVDKSLLQAAIHSVMALTESDYTDESWAELAAAVSNGNAVLDDADATQMDVDDATASINSAIAALVPVDPAGVDKSLLQAVIHSVMALTESDYTDESWAYFKAKLDAAKLVFADPNALQDEVEDVLAELLEAIENLDGSDYPVIVNPYRPKDRDRSSGGTDVIDKSPNTLSGSVIPSTGWGTVAEPNKPLTKTEAKKALTDRLAKLPSGSKSVIVTLQNIGEVSPEILQFMQAEARAQGLNLRLNLDTVVGGKVVGRVALHGGVNGDTGVKANVSGLDLNRAEKVTKIFKKYFKTKLFAACLATEGQLGGEADIAVKLPVGMGTDNLVVYSYSEATNTYIRLVNAKPWLDKNGYIHFTTSIGGRFIISDGKLTK